MIKPVYDYDYIKFHFNCSFLGVCLMEHRIWWSECELWKNRNKLVL